MLKDYRRRFVWSIMQLAGLALLLVFIVIGVIIARSEKTRLRNTMAMVMRPWETAGENFRTFEKDDRRFGPGSEGEMGPAGEASETSGNDIQPGSVPPGGMQPPDGSQRPGREGRGDNPFAENGQNIAVVIYDNESGEIYVLSDQDDIDRDALISAAETVLQQQEAFGTLGSYGLIYYKETTETNVRMALANSTVLSTAVLKYVLILAAAYIAIMALMFLISLRMAKAAAKPMEDAVAMERQFMADISHDLKTPITVVLANSSILRSNEDSQLKDQMQWIDSTEDAAKNMMKLVSEMLELSSLESEGRTAKKETVDLSSAAEKCSLQMESVAFERGVMMDSDIEEDVAATADREFVQRIFSGLIENALKYEPLGGSVNIGLHRIGRKAVFSVKNSGSSIAPEDLPHIFERFYRGDKSRGEKKGYGLGLPIIKTMADLIGADIEAKSSAEEGTVFTVRFEA